MLLFFILSKRALNHHEWMDCIISWVCLTYLAKCVSGLGSKSNKVIFVIKCWPSMQIIQGFVHKLLKKSEKMNKVFLIFINTFLKSKLFSYQLAMTWFDICRNVIIMEQSKAVAASRYCSSALSWEISNFVGPHLYFWSSVDKMSQDLPFFF